MKKLLIVFCYFTAINAMQQEDVSPKITNTDHQADVLPTRQEMRDRFAARERALVADLAQQGYAPRRNEGVVDLPILQWKSHESIERELGSFKIEHLKKFCPERVQGELALYEFDSTKYWVQRLAILGPKKCGKTTLAKFIAYKTNRPYIIVPPIFFTSAYTTQRLDIYFQYAKNFNHGAVFILKNLPKDDDCFEHGIDKICFELDLMQYKSNKISIIATCGNKPEFGEKLVNRLAGHVQVLDQPNYAARLDALKHYLAPYEQNCESSLQQLAHDLEGENWQKINSGIAQAKRAATQRAQENRQQLQITQQDIYEAFYEAIDRIQQKNAHYFWTLTTP